MRTILKTLNLNLSCNISHKTMNYLSLISLVCFAAVLVNAESGYYVPKGYYVIHADGQQSSLSQITPAHKLLMHRLRRSAQFSSSSSSSSSSVSSNGGPVFFHQSTSSNVSPGVSSQSYYPGVIGSINDRFNGDDDDDYYDDGPAPINNNRPTYSSSQTGTFVGNGFNRPGFSTTQIQSGNGIPNRINAPNSNYGNTVASHSSSVGNGINTQSSVSYPSSNGNVVFTQSNNNGVHTQTSGIIYPNGQVQITSQKKF